MQTSTNSHRTAPIHVPSDVNHLLYRFNISFDRFLTTSNPKLAKGADRARSAILHHLPHRALAQAVNRRTNGPTAPRSFLPELAFIAEREGLVGVAVRHNGCPWATNGCAAGCLAWAGHGGLSSTVASARGRRTLAMLADPSTYARAILWAVAREWHRANREGLPLAVRLRGTDEGPVVGWHRLRFPLSVREAITLERRFGLIVNHGSDITLGEVLALHRIGGSIKLYDYTKSPLSGPLGAIQQHAAGWDVTVSMAADRPSAVADAMAAIRAGFRVAVPVALDKGAPLPHTLRLAVGSDAIDVPTVNGDLTDHRWADPPAVAVILRQKRSRGADPRLASAFVLAGHTDPQALRDGTATLLF